MVRLLGVRRRLTGKELVIRARIRMATTKKRAYVRLKTAADEPIEADADLEQESDAETPSQRTGTKGRDTSVNTLSIH